ncbi:MAG: hypothetical protein HRU19_30725 [Pseudobacteriovorax sp.]|nr:hypothetical protein [Pseudobacteriovorax sp.]
MTRIRGSKNGKDFLLSKIALSLLIFLVFSSWKVHATPSTIGVPLAIVPIEMTDDSSFDWIKELNFKEYNDHYLTVPDGKIAIAYFSYQNLDQTHVFLNLSSGFVNRLRVYNSATGTMKEAALKDANHPALHS